jgi:large-conductance mechanosensitive channel
MKKKEEEEKPATPAEPPADIKLLGEIRDLLKK